MTTTGLRVWGCATPRTMRVHWALQELGLAYACEPIRPRSPEQQGAAFGAVSPRRKIPVLQDGALTIGESAAIVNHLAARHGHGATRLMPNAGDDRARYDEWCFFIMTELDATSLYVVRRHVGLPHIYGEAPEAVRAARAYFERQAGTVATLLGDGRPWLLGEAFTGADILLTTCLDWAAISEVALPDPLLAYQARARARPGYVAGRQANQPDHWTHG